MFQRKIDILDPSDRQRMTPTGRVITGLGASAFILTGAYLANQHGPEQASSAHPKISDGQKASVEYALAHTQNLPEKPEHLKIHVIIGDKPGESTIWDKTHQLEEEGLIDPTNFQSYVDQASHEYNDGHVQPGQGIDIWVDRLSQPPQSDNK